MRTWRQWPYCKWVVEYILAADRGTSSYRLQETGSWSARERNDSSVDWLGVATIAKLSELSVLVVSDRCESEAGTTILSSVYKNKTKRIRKKEKLLEILKKKK